MIPEFFNHFLETFILVSLVIFFTTLIYKLNKKNEDRKISDLITKFEEQKWTSPVINNLGFFLGVLFTTFGIWALYPILQSGQLTTNLLNLLIIVIILLGISLFWVTPFIKISAGSVTIQPLILKMLGLGFYKKEFAINDISEVSQAGSWWVYSSLPFHSIVVTTRNNQKVLIHTELFNSEVGNALYKYLKKGKGTPNTIVKHPR